MKEKHYLETVYWPPIGIINYRGHELHRLIGGYKVLNKIVTTPYEVNKVIEEAGKHIQKSIKQ